MAGYYITVKIKQHNETPEDAKEENYIKRKGNIKMKHKHQMVCIN